MIGLGQLVNYHLLAIYAILKTRQLYPNSLVCVLTLDSRV